MSFGAPFPGGPIITLSYIGNVENFSGLSSYTFAYTFSAAHPSRFLIAAFSWEGNGGTSFAETATIGGVAATQIGVTSGSPGGRQAAFFYALVPTNVTQNSVLSLARAALRAECALFDQEGLSYVNGSITGGTSLTFSETISVPAGGAVLGISASSGLSSPSNVWSGISEDFDQVFGTSNLYNFSGAHANFNAGNPSLTVANTISGSSVSARNAILMLSP